MFGRKGKEVKEKLERIEKILEADCITCVWCGNLKEMFYNVINSNLPTSESYCENPELDIDPDFKVNFPYARKEKCPTYFNLSEAPKEIKEAVNNCKKEQLAGKLVDKIIELRDNQEKKPENKTYKNFGEKP